MVEAAKNKSASSGHPVFYFYCETAQRDLLRAIDLFESLIKQSLIYMRMVQKPFPEDIMTQIEDLYRYGGPERDLDDVTGIFSDLFRYLETSTYILDGLDELKHGDIVHVFDLFRSLFQVPSEQKLFLSSRNELHDNVDLIHMVPRTRRIPMEQDNAQDIRHYIETKLAEKSSCARKLTEDDALAEEMASRLLSGTKGMLVAYCCKLFRGC